ncbi:MAG: tetratricopeptide repeat protein [Gammaproteobacteria bacterium]
MIPWKSIIGALLIGCSTPALLAAPFIPDDDRQVLEILPQAAVSISRELRALRTALGARPERAGAAFRLAERYIELGKSESDPRYYGYAEGLLQPWWLSADPPSEVLLLRALIMQNRHDFDRALLDLEKLLRRQPDNAKAWLARALILQVQARYPEAQQSCAALINFDDTLLAATCLSQVGSLMGHGLKSYRFLDESLKEGPAAPEQQQWSLTVLAEIAARLERNEDADRHFIEALRIGKPNVYLFAAYADFLLDQNRPEEVVALLSDKTRIDSLLLRLALARQQLAADDLSGLSETLQARFTAGRLRQENLHQGDEARFNLHLKKQPETALKLAKANWQQQKEPKDARILLEASIAANDPAAAKPVLDLLDQSGMEHALLRRLADRLKRMR